MHIHTYVHMFVRESIRLLILSNMQTLFIGIRRVFLSVLALMLLFLLLFVCNCALILNECIAFVHILVCKYKSFCLYTYVYKCTWVCEYVCAETINILMRIFCLFYNHLSCPVLFCPVLSVYGWYRSF